MLTVRVGFEANKSLQNEKLLHVLELCCSVLNRRICSCFENLEARAVELKIKPAVTLQKNESNSCKPPRNKQKQAWK